MEGGYVTDSTGVAQLEEIGRHRSPELKVARAEFQVKLATR